MLIIMNSGCDPKNIDRVVKKIESLGYKSHLSEGVEKTIIGAVGKGEKPAKELFESMPGVDHVIYILEPYKMSSRSANPPGTIVKVNGQVRVGGRKLVIIAGPCSVESLEQMMEAGQCVKSCGGHMIRGGAFKPRTSPYSFQGMGKLGLEILKEVRDKVGLPIVTEVMNHQDVELVSEYADVLQIGARNIQNYILLKMVGQCKKPILLKRGMMTTIQEYLMSAEYVLSSGNSQVILCERGIRTFETATRNTLDLSAVPVLKEKTHLPIIVDPSHGTGNWRYIKPMSYAAVAAGADGLMIEMHPKPEEAESDGFQSLSPSKFKELMVELKKFASAAGREL